LTVINLGIDSEYELVVDTRGLDQSVSAAEERKNVVLESLGWRQASKVLFFQSGLFRGHR